VPGVVEPPWRATADGVLWRSADGVTSVVFDDAGVTHTSAGGAPERIPWSQVTGVALLLPTATTSGYRVSAVLSRVGPVPFEHAPREVAIIVSTARREHAWDLGRRGRYSWRLAFALGELADLLAKTGQLSQLARPDLLDRVADEVVPQVPRRARMLVRADLLGLDRRLGGHGAYDRQLAALVGVVPGRS